MQIEILSKYIKKPAIFVNTDFLVWQQSDFGAKKERYCKKEYKQNMKALAITISKLMTKVEVFSRQTTSNPKFTETQNINPYGTPVIANLQSVSYSQLHSFILCQSQLVD
jgi:hypothetical protein